MNEDSESLPTECLCLPVFIPGKVASGWSLFSSRTSRRQALGSIHSTKESFGPHLYGHRAREETDVNCELRLALFSHVGVTVPHQM